MRRPSRQQGRTRPDHHRSLAILALAAAVIAAGCGGASVGTPSATATGSTAPGSGSIAPTSPPAASDALPSPTQTSEPTDGPDATDEPVETPATVEASSTAGSGPAAACAGSDENRDFFASVTAAVDWAVYCPVLGRGWFVETGQYRLAGGGWMEIAYGGPGGARLDIRQGAACATEDCVPSGTKAGEAAFGDRTGTLLILDGERSAVVVDPGETPSWTIVGGGLDQAAFAEIAADMARVGD